MAKFKLRLFSKSNRIASKDCAPLGIKTLDWVRTLEGRSQITIEDLRADVRAIPNAEVPIEEITARASGRFLHQLEVKVYVPDGYMDSFLELRLVQEYNNLLVRWGIDERKFIEHWVALGYPTEIK